MKTLLLSVATLSALNAWAAPATVPTPAPRPAAAPARTATTTTPTVVAHPVTPAPALTPAQMIGPVAKPVIVPTAATPANKPPEDACLQNLSEGVNRFKAKISLRGLKEMKANMAQAMPQLKNKNAGLFVDYTLNSSKKRAYLIDFKACDVVAYEYVIHGGALYHPTYINDGEKGKPGMLSKCVNRNGTHQHMTRPGSFITVGCHITRETGWTNVTGQCGGESNQGVKLKSADGRHNLDVLAGGVVLHEHTSIENNSSVKPMGQGCPAFPPGRLRNLLKLEDMLKGFFVFLYAPQCGTGQ